MALRDDDIFPIESEILDEFALPAATPSRPGAYQQTMDRISFLLRADVRNHVTTAIRLLTVLDANAEMLSRQKDGESLLIQTAWKLRQWQRSRDGWERLLSWQFIRLREQLWRPQK